MRWQFFKREDEATISSERPLNVALSEKKTGPIRWPQFKREKPTESARTTGKTRWPVLRCEVTHTEALNDSQKEPPESSSVVLFRVPFTGPRSLAVAKVTKVPAAGPPADDEMKGGANTSDIRQISETRHELKRRVLGGIDLDGEREEALMALENSQVDERDEENCVTYTQVYNRDMLDCMEEHPSQDREPAPAHEDEGTECPEDVFNRVVAKGFSGSMSLIDQGLHADDEFRCEHKRRTVSDVVRTLQAMRSAEIETFVPIPEESQMSFGDISPSEEGFEVADVVPSALEFSPNKLIGVYSVKRNVSSLVGYHRVRREELATQEENHGHCEQAPDLPTYPLQDRVIALPQQSLSRKRVGSIRRSIGSDVSPRHSCTGHLHREAAEFGQDIRDLRGVAANVARLPLQFACIDHNATEESETLDVISMSINCSSSNSSASSDIVFIDDVESIGTMDALIDGIKTGISSALSGDDGDKILPDRTAKKTEHWLW